MIRRAVASEPSPGEHSGQENLHSGHLRPTWFSPDVKATQNIIFSPVPQCGGEEWRVEPSHLGLNWLLPAVYLLDSQHALR